MLIFLVFILAFCSVSFVPFETNLEQKLRRFYFFYLWIFRKKLKSKEFWGKMTVLPLLMSCLSQNKNISRARQVKFMYRCYSFENLHLLGVMGIGYCTLYKLSLDEPLCYQRSKVIFCVVNPEFKQFVIILNVFVKCSCLFRRAFNSTRLKN